MPPVPPSNLWEKAFGFLRLRSSDKGKIQLPRWSYDPVGVAGQALYEQESAELAVTGRITR